MEPTGQIRITQIITKPDGDVITSSETFKPEDDVESVFVGRREPVYSPKPMTDKDLDELREFGFEFHQPPKEIGMFITPAGLSSVPIPTPTTPEVNWCQLPVDCSLKGLLLVRGPTGRWTFIQQDGPGLYDFYKIRVNATKRTARTMTQTEITERMSQPGYISSTTVINLHRFINYPVENENWIVEVTVEIL